MKQNENRCWWLFDVEHDPFQSTNLLGPKRITDNFLQIAKDMREKIEQYAKDSIAEPIRLYLYIIVIF